MDKAIPENHEHKYPANKYTIWGQCQKNINFFVWGRETGEGRGFTKPFPSFVPNIFMTSVANPGDNDQCNWKGTYSWTYTPLPKLLYPGLGTLPFKNSQETKTASYCQSSHGC